MKIVINIPKIKMPVRSWFDKMLQSLTYEEEVTTEKSSDKAVPKNEKHSSKLNTQSDKTEEELFVPKRKVKTMINATKIQIQTEDLQLISTALIRYKKHLAQNKQLEKAARVGELDRMFYEVIAQKTTSPEKAFPKTSTQKISAKNSNAEKFSKMRPPQRQRVRPMG